MSLRKLVVYYPDYTFLNKTYKFPNQPPERRGGGFGSRLSGSGEYHQESMLKYLYNVSHTADTTWTYYEVHNDHVPARSVACGVYIYSQAICVSSAKC